MCLAAVGREPRGHPSPCLGPGSPSRSLQRHWVGPVRAAAWPTFPKQAAEGQALIPSEEPSPPGGRDEPGAGGWFLRSCVTNAADDACSDRPL